MAKITIASHQVTYNGSTLPAFARIYCNQQFVNGDNQTVTQGDIAGANYVKQVVVARVW